jgi:hypothetical protein
MRKIYINEWYGIIFLMINLIGTGRDQMMEEAPGRSCGKFIINEENKKCPTEAYLSTGA